MVFWLRSLRWSVLALAILGAPCQLAAQHRELVNSGTVGLIIGSAESSDIALSADLVAALNDGYSMRLLPVLGQGSMRNIEDLLYLRGIDIAMVQADVLDFYHRTGAIEDLDQQIRYIARLADEEVHLLARRDIASIEALEGGRVNFGVDGSGSFMTAGILFDHRGIEVDITSFPLPIAIKELREGTLDAVVLVGAAPLESLQLLGAAPELHFLSITGDNWGSTYQKATISSDDYPELIEPGRTVETLAVAKILTAFNWPAGHPRGEKVDRFVERLFERAPELAQPPFHPKWREVDLLAPVSGWERLPVAATLVAEQR
jgi:TRAP-type uncharacterized transport system substrate-binding protein